MSERSELRRHGVGSVHRTEPRTGRPTPEAGRLAWEAYGPLGEMGGPMLAAFSDEQLRSAIRFLRGGTEINERRATELLSESAAAKPRAGSKDSNEG